MRNRKWFRADSLMLLLLVAALGSAHGGLTVTFTKAFAPSTIGPGGASTLTFTITNPDPGSPLDELAFTDVLPAGVTIANPPRALSFCGGVLSAPAGGATITFSGGMVGASRSCTIRVDVTSATVGTHMNVSGTLSSEAGSHGTASADLVVAADRPGLSKAFSPSTVTLGGRSTLTFTIDNSANPASATTLNFVDSLPAGMVVASPANAATDCGTAPLVPTLSAAPGSSLISLNYSGSVVSPGVAAMATCTVSVDVTGGAVGMLGNTSGDLAATVAGMIRSGGKAAAVLTVTGGAAEPILLIKEFTDDPVAPGGTVTAEFTITNTSRADTATAIAFSDDLNAALTGLTFAGVGLNTCNATPTGTGTTMLDFSGASLAPEATCSFTATLTVPAGATPGTYTNTTSTITATVGGAGVTGSAASALLFVTAFPILTKEFTDDPVGAGGTVTLEFTISNTNTASALGNIAFIDELTDGSAGVPPDPTSGFLPFPVSVGLPPMPNPPCGPMSSLALVSRGTDRQALELTGGSLAAAGSMGDSCTFSVTVDIPAGFPGGTYTNFTEEITAELTDLMNAPVTGPAATGDLVVAGPPTLTKEFTDDPVAPGGTVTLEFTVEHDATAVGDATAIAFTDDLSAVIAGLTATSVLTNTCAGATVDISTPTLIDVTGGTLMPGEICTIEVVLSVPAGAMPGSFPNTSSDLAATVSGVATTGNPASDDLRVAGLMLIKEFTDDPAIPGDTVNLRFTLDNTAGVADDTAISFSDDLDAALSGLIAVAPLPMAPCGGTIAGTTSLSFSGGSVMAGSSCFFDVTVMVPAMAANGAYLNATGNLIATIGGVPGFVLDPATDLLEVDDQLLAIGKSFTDDPAIPGGTVTLELTVSNLDLNRAAGAIAFSDDLGAALAGLTIGSVLLDDCGGALGGVGTDMLSYTGGSLAAGGSCTVRLSLDVPAGPLPGDTFTNTTSTVTGTINGFPVSGPAASDDLRVIDILLAKAFGGIGFPGQTVTLTFTITNLDASEGATNLAFSDDLPAGLTAVAPLPTNPCGAGSTISGTTFLTLSGGSLGPSGMCSFPVTLLVPAMTVPGSFPNVTSDLFSSGLSVSGPGTDALTVEPPPAFAKSFAPASVGIGQTTTLSFSIDNTASTVAAGSLAFTDNLPAGIAVAATPAVSNGCGGAVTANAGATAISLAGGSVGAGASCVIQVDVTATANGALVNTTGDLTSSSGNSGSASDTLTVNPQPGFAKAFAPNPIAVGGVSTLTFTIDNSASTVSATNLAFTDNLPAAVVIATPANATTTCSGGTLSAPDGGGTIGYAGGTVAAGASCTVSADVTSGTAGTHGNTSGDLTSNLGNSGPAGDSLTVNPPPAFAKAFAPNPVVAGDVSTLTFTIDNSASTADATGLDFTDNLPAAVTITTPSNATTDCTGGMLTAPGGGGTISYGGGTVIAGASCTVAVDVTSVTSGSHVNTSGDLTSSLGISGPASDTLIVNPAPVPVFAKSFAPNPIVQGATSTLTFMIDNSGSLVDADNLVFTDSLPAGLLVATPPNATTSCAGGTLTAPAAGGTIDYAGGALAAGASCTIAVDLVALAAGGFVNTSGDLTSTLGNSGPASDTLNVTPAPVPGFLKSFAPAAIAVGGTSTLTFTIDNSGSLVDATGLDFTDALPAGVSIATPANAATDCAGGTLSAPDGGGTIGYSGGTVAAGATCTVSVEVTGTAAGMHINSSGDLTSSLGNSGPASAMLDVAGSDLSLAKAFLSDPVLPGGTIAVELTLTNASTFAASAIAFMDDLNGAIPGLTALGLPLNACGGTLTGANGDTELSFAGGSLAAGTSCVIAVSLRVPPGAAPGPYTNTTGPVSGDLGGVPVSGPAASAGFNVAFLSFTKAFTGDVPAGAVAALVFTITNPDPVNGATGVGFTDDLDAFIPGAEAIQLPQSDVCGAGSSLTGTSVVTLSDGTLGPGGSCTFQVRIQIPFDTVPGDYANVTGPLAATVGGAAVTGAGAVVATAVLGVGAVMPVPSLSAWALLVLIGLVLVLSARRLWRR